MPLVRQFGTFNFLLSNGEALWAHCSTKLHWLVRQHPFAQATLMDQDWTVNFAELNHPGDRAAVVVTTPLTSNEQWTAFEPNELKVFVDGRSDYYRQGTVLNDYSKIMAVKPMWSELLRRYDIGWMLLTPGEALETTALASGAWRREYADRAASLLVRVR